MWLHVIVFVTSQSRLIGTLLCDIVGLISHLCTVFNGRVKEETGALQSRAGLSPWEPESARGHLLTCLPPRRTCSSHYVFMFTDVNTISHFLIYNLCFLSYTSCVSFSFYARLSVRDLPDMMWTFCDGHHHVFPAFLQGWARITLYVTARAVNLQ